MGQLVLTTDTLEGVDTPVTVPPPLLLEELPPLQAVRNIAHAVRLKPSFKEDEKSCLMFIMISFVNEVALNVIFGVAVVQQSRRSGVTAANLRLAKCEVQHFMYERRVNFLSG